MDEYLVILAQGGSREAFDQLVRRWTPRLLRYCARTVGTRELARDIVQESWVGAIRGLRKLTDPAMFSPWIYRIAHRKCVDAIRSNQRRGRLAVRAYEEPGVENIPDVTDLESAIARLSEEQRHVIQLFYGEELSVEQTAAVLGVPGGTVKSRLYHARESLKRQLGE
jgi:RNA polymerase sigma-70 factor (ECF subfamily)